MNRRGFFATLAALCAAPAALFRSPKAKAEPAMEAVIRAHKRFAELDVKGPVDEFEARKRYSKADLPPAVQKHLDAMWGNGKPTTHTWGPALKHISGTSAP